MRGTKSMKSMLRRGPVAAGFLTGMLIWTAVPARAEPGSWQIEGVAGEATLLHAGERSPAVSGTPLSAKDQLRTGSDGRVEILCSDRS